MIGGLVIAGLVCAGVAVGFKRLKKKSGPRLDKENIPERLGVLDGVPIDHLLHKLDAALDEDYIALVKQRFLEENQRVSEDEFEWRLFEMKRYFVLTKVLRSAPMFSEEVDEVWHGMLLFTQRYQTFSEKFTGRMLHHTPNMKPEPAPQERAFFDWVFSQLFEVTQFTWKTWGSFFRHPLDAKLLYDFAVLDKEMLIEKYFSAVNEDNRVIVDYLVDRLKKQIAEAEGMYTDDKKGVFGPQRMYGEMTGLSLMMVFYSYYYFDEYWSYAKAYAFTSPAQYISGCSTAVFCGAAYADDSYHRGGGGSGHHCSGGGHGHDGGSHCSGSSCSSCSSCGGGCAS